MVAWRVEGLRTLWRISLRAPDFCASFVFRTAASLSNSQENQILLLAVSPRIHVFHGQVKDTR